MSVSWLLCHSCQSSSRGWIVPISLPPTYNIYLASVGSLALRVVYQKNCILIVIVVVVVIVVVSYWPCLSFLPRHVHTMSWPHYKVASILDVTCCVVQPCYVHARRRHVSPFIAPRCYYCLSFLPKDNVLHHPLIVGCCVIHVVCHSLVSFISHVCIIICCPPSVNRHHEWHQVNGRGLAFIIHGWMQYNRHQCARLGPTTIPPSTIQRAVH